MAHHQVRLDLLQGVNHHANENQKRRTTEELTERVLHIQQSAKAGIMAMKAMNKEPGNVKRDITVSM